MRKNNSQKRIQDLQIEIRNLKRRRSSRTLTNTARQSKLSTIKSQEVVTQKPKINPLIGGLV